jgi:septal ring factor EnvC (AmiA/AmiB activator)
MAEIDARITRVRADKAPLELQREALVRARQALVEAEERRAAFTRAFDTSGRPDAVAIYGADMGPTQDGQGGFRMLRGRLSFPIAGRAEVQQETRAGGPGLAFVTSPFTGVRSVAAGRVAFADRQEEYGLTVILDHGDRYFTLYGSLGRLDVRVGDSVAAGARLGTAGSTDGSPAMLYFEIRRNGATLDPRPWLGL